MEGGVEAAAHDSTRYLRAQTLRDTALDEVEDERGQMDQATTMERKMAWADTRRRSERGC